VAWASLFAREPDPVHDSIGGSSLAPPGRLTSSHGRKPVETRRITIPKPRWGDTRVSQASDEGSCRPLGLRGHMPTRSQGLRAWATVLRPSGTVLAVGSPAQTVMDPPGSASDTGKLSAPHDPPKTRCDKAVDLRAGNTVTPLFPRTFHPLSFPLGGFCYHTVIARAVGRRAWKSARDVEQPGACSKLNELSSRGWA